MAVSDPPTIEGLGDYYPIMVRITGPDLARVRQEADRVAGILRGLKGTADVRVDYNPPLAGKGLRYKFTIVEEVADPVQKIKGFIELAYGQGRADGFQVDAQGDKVTITLPDSCKYDQRWFVAKYRLVSDLRTFAGVKTTRFVEEYATTEPSAPAGETHTHEDGTVHAGPTH